MDYNALEIVSQAIMGHDKYPFIVSHFRYLSDERGGPKHFVTVTNTAKGEVGRMDYYLSGDAKVAAAAEITKWSRIVGPVYARLEDGGRIAVPL